MGNEVKKWNEREGHKLEPQMVSRVINKDIETLIIGIGVNGGIDCPGEVIKYIRKTI